MIKRQITPPQCNSIGETKRQGGIEALRFFFICIICLWHCSPLSPWLHNGYIAVEFFFVLSGAMMYKSYSKHPEVGVLEYTLRRVQKFVIPFWVSIFLLMCIDRKQYFYISDFTPDGIISKYFIHLHELFFCQHLNLVDKPVINYPLWFLSVLIFGGSFLYSLLKNYGTKATSLFIPLICLFGFPLYLHHSQYNVAFIDSWMLRGIAEMGLGVLTAKFCIAKDEALTANSKAVNVVSVVAIFVFILMMLAKQRYDYLLIFIVPLVLLPNLAGCSCLDRIFRHRIWNVLGGLSMYMYFIHLLIASLYFIFCNTSIIRSFPVYLLSIAYLMIVIVSAFALKYFSNILYRKLSKC